MNLPNKLTCLRMAMIPLFLFFMIFPEICGFTASRIIAAILFGLTAFTDMLDGKIARKYNMVTDFGKFMDPLADKLMIFGSMIGTLTLTYQNSISNGSNSVLELGDFLVNDAPNYRIFAKVFAIVAFLIIFRELAVTSMRMIASNKTGVVISANIFGKLKTVSQIAGIIVITIEPLIWSGFVASYVMCAFMLVTTMYSGYTYFRDYLSSLKRTQEHKN